MALLPSIPGAPTLLRPPAGLPAGLQGVQNRAVLLFADAKQIISLFGGPKWGLFLNGKSVAEADSVRSIEFRQDSKLSDYPQQKGAFESYNKVASPFDARLQFTKGGATADRAKFLDAIDKAANSLDLYEVTTPEKVYKSANIQRYDYHRTADSGVGLLTVDLWLIEIRETVSVGFTNSKQPPGSQLLNAGTVQGQVSFGAVKNALTTGLDRLSIGGGYVSKIGN
jgi:hypothetical protein